MTKADEKVEDKSRANAKDNVNAKVKTKGKA